MEERNAIVSGLSLSVCGQIGTASPLQINHVANAARSSAILMSWTPRASVRGVSLEGFPDDHRSHGRPRYRVFLPDLVVLLQSGKAADLAGAFGGMGSQTAFGPRGSATVLSKATTIAAVLFMVTSLSLSVLYTRSGSAKVGGASVLDHTAPAKSSAPAAPAQSKSGSQTVPLPLPTAPAKK